jgi:hypothetical protein
MPAPAQPSQLNIINLALTHLKNRRISSLTENSVQANAANACYETARRETLRGHDWPWATCITSLALNATYAADASGLYAGKWSYAYTYPANCIAMWHIYTAGTIDKSKGEDFREVYDPVNNQKILLTDCADALGEYTFDLSDTTLWDSNFVTAFAYRLAADMAPALTGDDSIAEDMLKKSIIAISESERMASYETNVNENTTSTYEDAR